MYNSLKAASPISFRYPITATEEEYAKAFFNKSKKDIIKQQLSNYLDIINWNETLKAERKKLSKTITIQLSLIVIIILIESLMPILLIYK